MDAERKRKWELMESQLQWHENMYHFLLDEVFHELPQWEQIAACIPRWIEKKEGRMFKYACPGCSHSIEGPDNCNCAIATYTGRTQCCGTPYYDYDTVGYAYTRTYATNMMNWLIDAAYVLFRLDR